MLFVLFRFWACIACHTNFSVMPLKWLKKRNLEILLYAAKWNIPKSILHEFKIELRVQIMEFRIVNE